MFILFISIPIVELLSRTFVRILLHRRLLPDRILYLQSYDIELKSWYCSYFFPSHYKDLHRIGNYHPLEL